MSSSVLTTLSGLWMRDCPYSTDQVVKEIGVSPGVSQMNARSHIRGENIKGEIIVLFKHVKEGCDMVRGSGKVALWRWGLNWDLKDDQELNRQRGGGKSMGKECGRWDSWESKGHKGGQGGQRTELTRQHHVTQEWGSRLGSQCVGPLKPCWGFWSLACGQGETLKFLSLGMEALWSSVLHVENFPLAVTWGCISVGKDHEL